MGATTALQDGAGCAKGEANGTTRRGSSSSEGRCDPAGWKASHGCIARSRHPLRCPIPFQGPSGDAPERYCVALLGIVDLATTCVARLGFSVNNVVRNYT
jgi:hypothetical protein